jgi:uncharacterized protein (DUF1499 family)
VKLLAGVLGALLLLALGLVAGALALNRVPLFEPPGPVARLEAYLTTNVAETGADSPFPELRPRRFDAPPPLVLQAAAEAATRLGWKEVVVDGEARRIMAVVETPLLGFRDDIVLWVEEAPEGGSVLQARSESRVGRGDLGANAKHVRNAFGAVADILAWER